MKIRDLRDDDVVTNPDWAEGRPVRVTKLGASGVRYQDLTAHGRARQVDVNPDTEVTVKARRWGGR
ncbi:hypothetical protein [Nonomuraea rhodomycinica]|uniref:Uncharacterized protein n=1 Tax=Nonomuraea rhodomycinica TaxID=1712872 RepID=A0A7Y6IWA9_9ACTN|nr:hypothetical protein [Nonomuraea rhodomycinica]NUW45596.1 hypothetical protein [Nonomuraea rhodomycinica]